METGKQVIVGVNKFQVKEDLRPAVLRVDPALGRQQAQKLAALRLRRDNAATSAALAALEDAARGSANLLPCILAAVEAWATLGEISDTLRRVFGEQNEQASL